MNMFHLIKKLIRDEGGQNTAEYGLIVMGVILTVYLVMDVFANSLVSFHYDIASVLCLPVP